MTTTKEQQIKVIATSPIEFFKIAQEAIIRGARYKEGTFVSLQTLPLMAEMSVEVDQNPESEWKDNGPHIWATPLPIEYFKYSKEQMEALDWETFKTVCGSYEITGRHRVVMTAAYLQATGQEN